MACVIYRDLFGAWRWEMRQDDGGVTESQHSYTTRAQCVAAAPSSCAPVADSTGLELQQASGDRRTSVLPRRSALCVHSNPDAQNLFKDTLTDYRVVITPTGFEALRCINYAVFDLYILDYWLPDWTGVSLCRDIRKLDPRGPVCFYTAAEGVNHRQRALNAGASLYLQAPIDASSLSRQLARLLDAADEESLRARFEGERVIETELERRAAAAAASSGGAMDRAAAAIERTAKVKAYQAFIDAGGTRAHFERWWPQLFASAWASRPVTASSEASP